jgi:hypothetical protein
MEVQTIKPPLLTQIEEYMKDKNPDEYSLIFNNEGLALIFKYQPVNGVIMDSQHSSFIPEGQMVIFKKGFQPFTYKIDRPIEFNMNGETLYGTKGLSQRTEFASPFKTIN